MPLKPLSKFKKNTDIYITHIPSSSQKSELGPTYSSCLLKSTTIGFITKFLNCERLHINVLTNNIEALQTTKNVYTFVENAKETFLF